MGEWLKESENKWRGYDGKEIVPRKIKEKKCILQSKWSFLRCMEFRRTRFQENCSRKYRKLFLDDAVACPENECEIENYENEPEKKSTERCYCF